MRRLPIDMLALSVFLTSCGNGGTGTSFDTPTPMLTPAVSFTVAEIEELAAKHAPHLFRQMVTVSKTTASPVSIWRLKPVGAER